MRKPPGQKQLQLFAPSKSPLVVLDRNHRLVRLCDALDWLELEAKAQQIRMRKLESRAGRPPDLRVNLGAVIFMAMRQIPYRQAEDLIRHYGPARYLCGLTDSLKTPDFTTINDFMLQMGSDGMAELNAMAVQMAVNAGFGDPGVLVADTTVQEAPMGYPTEVGLLASFFRSVSTVGRGCGRAVKLALDSVQTSIRRGEKAIRTHRFFAKSKEERLALTSKAVGAAKSVARSLGAQLTKGCASRFTGTRKRARRQLRKVLESIDVLLPQIESWLKTGYVAKNKVVNLMLPFVRAIPRGKVGKDVEFGIKWGISRIGGGFILGQANASRGNFSDQKHVPEALDLHNELFGCLPDFFGYDRGGWSDGNSTFLEKAGVRHNGIAPKGQAKWKVKGRIKQRVVKERARIEGDIGAIKGQRYGFNRPAARSEEMMIACGHRAMLGYNLNKLLRYQAANDGIALIG